MFPIRDHNPSNRTPFVTWALIAANCVIFLLYYPELSAQPARLMGFYDAWALVPAEISRGIDGHTLLTSMFLHGGWMHLAGNMLFLWIFGDNVEDLLGHLGFLVFYLASGVAASLGQWLADPGSTVPVVGASGAIAGVMGGYLLMFPKARVDILVILVVIFRVFTVPAWAMLGFWFAVQLVSGASADLTGGGVAYWAHTAGFVAGAAFLLPAWLRRGGPAWWNRTHGHPLHSAAHYRDTRSGIPRVTRDGSGHVAEPLSAITRVPRAGRRRGGRRNGGGPWSGGT
ncbi:rhomboid family intramembrane serine protease [Rhodobacterales bacterium HKCCE2091]|nr:rhomboid family intramembrane serine protease [Rhodobacterales bacterium HKCCE2091]